MPNYIVSLSDGTKHTIHAESGGEARRVIAKAIRMGVPPFNPEAKIFRVRMVNQW
jgi:hypothetical protein